MKCFLLLIFVLQSASEWRPSEAAEAAGIRFTKQGPVRGLRVVVRPDLGLGKVDAYLGLPYASPPMGQFRFMPPMSPQSWSPRVREAVEPPPVCPQVIPDLSDKNKALRYMTVGRYNYLTKLFAHLQDQSEDCLYLNIYTPTNSAFAKGPKDDLHYQGLSVMVFIHGESYEWNSGNPYDGSVLAAYANVVVVTLNYRLGVLGFLRPGLERDVVSNFGLLDQIAALHWIKENIGAFGGDPDAVTLMGHGSGASLVSFLMTSPVAKAEHKELFQRAILMSGSSLSPMAVCEDPKDITMQVFRGLNCTSESLRGNSGAVSDVTISRCLKEASLHDLLTVKLNVPMYTTPFGPIVDGVVIPDNPLTTLSHYKTFAKYDVMFGLTESEAFHLFPASLVTYGVNGKEQRSIVRDFLKNIYNVNVDQILTAVMNEYTDYRHTGENKMVNRDTLLAIFSDARVSAPVVKTASLHAEGKEPNQAYLYVFRHVTKKGYYPQVFGSLHGEELAYGLGMPLTGGSNHLKQNYTFQEQVLSEVMMHYWGNFAKTGNPSPPLEDSRSGVDLGSIMSSSVKSQAVAKPQKVLTSPFAQTFQQIAPTWPPFNPQSQKYMALDLECSVNSFYRPHKMALWNHLVPDLVQLSVQERETEKLPRYPTLEDLGNSIAGGSRNENSGMTQDSHDNRNPQKTPTYVQAGPEISEGGIPVLMVVIIGIVLLMLNVCWCGSVIYQKNRVREREDNLRRRIKRLSDAGMIHGNGGGASGQGSQLQPSSNEANNGGASKYCVSNDQPVCNHDDSEASEDDEAGNGGSETSGVNEDNKVYVISTHHHLPYAQPVKSALRHHPLMNVSYDDNSVSNTSSLTRDLRWSRSMGNNLDSYGYGGQPQHPQPLHHLPSSHVANSRSIAALDVLPRNNALHQSTHPVIVNEAPPNRRTMLPQVLEPPSMLCHSLRRFANGSTTGSSASGSRPPSPIIEVIPVSEYEHLYGGLGGGQPQPPQQQPSPIYTNQYPASLASNSVCSYASTATGVVYPLYNRSSMSSTLPPMSASSTVSAAAGGLRHIDYAPRGNFAAANKPLRPMQPLQQQQANTSVSYWKSGTTTLQHHQQQQPPLRPLLHQPPHAQRPMPPNFGSSSQQPYSRQQVSTLPLDASTSAASGQKTRKRIDFKLNSNIEEQKAPPQKPLVALASSSSNSGGNSKSGDTNPTTTATVSNPSTTSNTTVTSILKKEHQPPSNNTRSLERLRNEDYKPATIIPSCIPIMPKQQQQQQQQTTTQDNKDSTPKVRGPVWQAFVSSTLERSKKCPTGKDEKNLDASPITSTTTSNEEAALAEPTTTTANPFLTTTTTISSSNSTLNEPEVTMATTGKAPLAPKDPSSTECSTSASSSTTASVVTCQTEEDEEENNSISQDEYEAETEEQQNGDANEKEEEEETTLASSPVETEKTYVLRKVGEKTPPGTLKKSKDRPTSSCKSWCEQYSQTFLARTIDTPLPDPGPYSEDLDETET